MLKVKLEIGEGEEIDSWFDLFFLSQNTKNRS